MIRSFGLPVVVAVNRFPADTAEELAAVKKVAEAAGAFAAEESRGFAEGGAGCVELAEAVVSATEGEQPDITYAYPSDSSIEDKVKALAQKVYNADDVAWAAPAARQLRKYRDLGWGDLPVCMAKTHLSLSHNPRLKGVPKDYVFEVSGRPGLDRRRLHLPSRRNNGDHAGTAGLAPNARRGRRRQHPGAVTRAIAPCLASVLVELPVATPLDSGLRRSDD